MRLRPRVACLVASASTPYSRSLAAKVPSPLRAVFTPTVFDQLTQRGVSWTCFEHTYCFLRFFEQHTFDDQHIVAFDDPVAGFEALAKAGRLPAVSFIDPHFVDLPPGSNCDEPPSDIRAGQALVQRVVEAVVGGARWDRTLLLITYDEHGGFFYHVPPPAAINVEQGLPPTCGLRVPTFVVSPWVAPGSLFGHDATAAGGSALHFDHTSILKTIARRFMATDPPYMGPRFAAANDLSAVIGPVLRSGQFLPFVAYHLRDDASRQRLTTVGSAVGAAPQLAAPDDGPAQRFSFEDAGEGWFYIRAQGSRLYLSVDASQNVTQQPRLRPPADPGSDAPADGQRWRLTPDPTLHGDPTRLTIRSAAFPTKSLQPAAGDTAQAVVVLGDPRAVAGQRIVNPWQVTLASEADDSAASATGPAISTLRDVFTTADSIAVMWAGLPGNPKDWLALATAGAAAKSVLDWTYVGGAVSGSTTFSGTRLNPGTYVARAMVDDGYTVVAESTAFTVTALAAGTVATDRASYAQGESIDIRWSGLTDHTTNWVAYAPAGSPATTVTRWAYAGGRAAGSLQFEGPPAAGTYVARTFADDTYVLTAESAAFVVR